MAWALSPAMLSGVSIVGRPLGSLSHRSEPAFLWTLGSLETRLAARNDLIYAGTRGRKRAISRKTPLF